MIHIKPKIDARYFVSQRAWMRAMEKANQRVGEIFHTEMLPERFKKGAAQKYGYKPRSPKYLAWKLKKFKSRRPMRNGQYVEGSGVTDNVLSGDMRDQMTRAGVIRSFPTRVSVTMNGPRYMTMRTRGSQPDKLNEVFTTTEGERQRLAAEMEKVLEREAA